MEDLVALHPDVAEWQVMLAHTTGSVGTILSEQGDFQGALESFDSALEVQRRLVSRDPDDPDGLRELARLLAQVGTLLQRSGEVGEAVSSHSEALEIRERLVSSEPDNALWLRDLAPACAGALAVGVPLVLYFAWSGAIPAAFQSLVLHPFADGDERGVAGCCGFGDDRLGLLVKGFGQL